MIDVKTLNKYAVKFFKDDEDYIQEKSLVFSLQSKFTNYQDLFMPIHSFDEGKKVLFYESGICSLQEINNIFEENNIYWYKIEPVLRKIIYEMSKIFILFLQKGVYHSDLKPANIVFTIRAGKLSKHVKLIDFGCCTENYKDLSGTGSSFKA